MDTGVCECVAWHLVFGLRFRSRLKKRFQLLLLLRLAKQVPLLKNFRRYLPPVCVCVCASVQWRPATVNRVLEKITVT